MWNKIGRIVTLLSKRLNITPERALDIFYESETCERFYNPQDFLFTLGDRYIIDDLITELQQKKC